MKIHRILWKVREDASLNRRFIVTLVQAGDKPTARQLAQIAEMDEVVPMHRLTSWFADRLHRLYGTAGVS